MSRYRRIQILSRTTSLRSSRWHRYSSNGALLSILVPIQVGVCILFIDLCGIAGLKPRRFDDMEYTTK